MSHTPGPWYSNCTPPRAGGACMYADAVIAQGESLRQICAMPAAPFRYDRQQAFDNMRLAAAAPDLLSALRDLLRVSMMEFAQDGFDNWQRETIAAEDRARLAIARATTGEKS